MVDATGSVKILLVDDDDLLLSDAQGLNEDGVAFAIARSTAEARLRVVGGRFDVLVVSLAVAGGEDMVRDLARSGRSPRIIAIAGHAARGVTLEHTLIRAELRGAVLALPKPIDAVELALAAVTAAAEIASPQGACAALVAGLERRLAF